MDRSTILPMRSDSHSFCIPLTPSCFYVLFLNMFFVMCCSFDSMCLILFRPCISSSCNTFFLCSIRHFLFKGDTFATNQTCLAIMIVCPDLAALLSCDDEVPHSPNAPCLNHLLQNLSLISKNRTTE